VLARARARAAIRAARRAYVTALDAFDARPCVSQAAGYLRYKSAPSLDRVTISRDRDQLRSRSFRAKARFAPSRARLPFEISDDNAADTQTSRNDREGIVCEKRSHPTLKAARVRLEERACTSRDSRGRRGAPRARDSHADGLYQQEIASGKQGILHSRTL